MHTEFSNPSPLCQDQNTFHAAATANQHYDPSLASHQQALSIMSDDSFTLCTTQAPQYYPMTLQIKLLKHLNIYWLFRSVLE